MGLFMSKIYSKPGYGNEKILYDSNGKVIGRGVTDRNGKTIYSGAGGYVGKSYNTSIGTVKHFDSNNNFVGTGINRSGFSTIICKDLEKDLEHESTSHNFSVGRPAMAQPTASTEIPFDIFEFMGEKHIMPTYVTLKPDAMRKLYTDIPYAILEQQWKDDHGQIIYQYKSVNRVGYWNYHKTTKSPDEMISELKIDYCKADINHFMLFPTEDKKFHLAMYDQLKYNRSPEYYLKKMRKEKIKEAVGLVLLGILILCILISIFS